MFHLSDKSWIRVTRNAIPITPELVAALWAEKPATQDTLKIYGKEIPMPRFQKLYGTHTYRFSGNTLANEEEMPELVKMCMKYAQEHAPDFDYNGALVNFYCDKNHSIGFHADDERDLVKDAPIYSFSFGGVRTFQVKAMVDEVNVTFIEFPTHDNSVIVMGGEMQKEFQHGIPKTKKEVKPRINVTVRSFSAKKQKLKS
jgi:alkylated DNA repair dioxygenase AlkB